MSLKDRINNLSTITKNTITIIIFMVIWSIFFMIYFSLMNRYFPTLMKSDYGIYFSLSYAISTGIASLIIHYVTIGKKKHMNQYDEFESAATSDYDSETVKNIKSYLCTITDSKIISIMSLVDLGNDYFAVYYNDRRNVDNIKFKNSDYQNWVRRNKLKRIVNNVSK